MSDGPNDGLVWVRATVNLPGLRAGAIAIVDPERPSIRRRIAATHLTLLERDETDELDRKVGREED